MNDVNDLIRRGDVINELKKCNFPTPSVEYINTMKDVEILADACKTCALGTVMTVPDAMPHWIPFSKQMPPVEEWLWVTTRRGEVVKLSLNHLNNFFYDENDDYWCNMDYVKAWMPYYEPEAYVE